MATKQMEKPQASAPPTVNVSGGILSSAVNHVASRAVPYLPPWAAAYGLPPTFGAATHAMWGHSALTSGLACAALGTGGAVLSAVTWAVAGGNNKFRRFRRAQATATVAAGMGWLTTATAAGPFGHPTIDAWLIGAAGIALSWNIRQVMRHAHDETEHASEDKGGWGKLAEAIGMEKFQLKRVKGNGRGVVTAEVSVPAGKTVEDAQAAAPRLAAATNVPPSGVTVTRDSDDAGTAYLKLRVADMLKDGIRFEMPRELGLLPTEPIPCGLYADGEPMVINPFEADILQHLLVMGVTGAGKSEFARTVLAHLMTRRQLSTMLVDLSKGRQTVGHIKEGLDWFITDKREAKHLVKALPGAIKARGDFLADEGLDQWSPQSELNAVVVWFEEAADTVDFEELDQIARAARSVGIWLVISLQRATWTNISTDVRANLQACACFGVNEAADASFCLPDRVTESGAIPDWGADRPGYGYATGMGIPAERWTTEWRGGLTDREELAALVAAAAPFRDPLDGVTARALGLPYAQRGHKGTNRLNAVPGAAVAAVVRQAIEAPDLPVYATEADEDEEMPMELQEAYEQVMGLIPADPEPDADYASLRLEDEVPEAEPDSDMSFVKADKPSTEEARNILYGQLDDWARSNRLTFETGDLIPATVAAGRKRGWLQNELKRLVEVGVLSHDSHGEYSILQSPLVPA